MTNEFCSVLTESYGSGSGTCYMAPFRLLKVCHGLQISGKLVTIQRVTPLAASDTTGVGVHASQAHKRRFRGDEYRHRSFMWRQVALTLDTSMGVSKKADPHLRCYLDILFFVTAANDISKNSTKQRRLDSRNYLRYASRDDTSLRPHF